MDRRVPHPLLLTGLAAFVVLLGTFAFAGPKDAAALKLDDDAIFNDYLATKFTEAERKLKQALTLCGRAGCSPNVVAQVRRDLGIVYVVTGRTDEARAQFAEAVRMDPATALPKDLATPEIQQVFQAARSGAAGPPPADTTAPSDVGPPPPGQATDDEDIIHTPIAEAALMTPMVIFAELNDGVSASKVQARYKVFGSPDWKKIDLKKVRGGYGAEIPCTEIGSTPGEMRYFIVGLGRTGEVIATHGTRNAPHKIVLRENVAEEPRHLPGKPTPERCKGAMQVDCPPGLPGCQSDRKKGSGIDCERDSECASGVCLNGMCGGDDKTPEATKCETDLECGTGRKCVAGSCASTAKKNWLGLAVQQDVLMLPSTTDVCLDSADYSCFYSDNTWYEPGLPETVGGVADEIKGGFARSTTRILLSYDHTFGTHIAAGVRVGYAFGGGPAVPGGKLFFPAHVELRLAYWLGKNPFASTSLRPYFVLAGGVAQFDSSVVVQVYERGNPEPIGLAAWKKAGTSFVGGGFGVMYPFGANAGIVAEIKAQQAFSASALGANFQLGFVTGL